MAEVAIRRAGLEQLDDLEPLWTAMHAHHRSVAGHLTEVAPFRSDARSWSRRRARYERVLASPDAFVLIAERDGRPIGYALVAVTGTEATLEVGDRVAELDSLSVLPDERGDGLGSRLMEAVFEELRRLEIEELSLAVMEGNEGAKRFYERRGFVPYLNLMLGRAPPAR